jgi:hypothetical protein
MGAARRFCVRASVLAWMMSTILGLALPGCEFPKYSMGNRQGGSGGSPEGGEPNAAAGDPDPSGQGGSDTAGAAGDGTGGEGGETTPPPPSCAPSSCVPKAPTNWRGPIALWEGKSADVPDCPTGYGKAMDRHSGLIAPAGACTCSCKAQDQVCETTTRIYSDMSCSTACATVPTQACNAVPGCTGSQGSLRADLPTISGGSCQAVPSGAPVAPTWGNDARLCQPTGTCEDANQVCAPTPDGQYLTTLCVFRNSIEGQPPWDCPDEYPIRKEYYERYTDSRGCTDCGCGSVTGGSCSGKLLMSRDNDCSEAVEFALGGACKVFNLGSGTIHPSSVGGVYTVTAGTCSVATPPQPTGKAVPSGALTQVCCSE